MSLKPGLLTPAGDIEFFDGFSKKSYIVSFDGGLSALNIVTKSDDVMALYLNSVGKKIGDFDEQRSWKGGRGRQFFNDDPTGYLEGKDIWSLSDHQLCNAPQWYWSTGYRTSDTHMPTKTYGSVTWKALIPGKTEKITTIFSAYSSYSADKVIIYLKRVGNPGTLTVTLDTNVAGNPSGTPLKTVTKTVTDVTDILSLFIECDWTTTQALTIGTSYHIVEACASTDNTSNHWEIGVADDASAKSKTYNGSSWTSEAWSAYYRVVDADIDRRWFFFHYNNKFYAVDSPATGTSTLLEWDEANDAWIVVGSTGLGIVTSVPVVFNNFVYFPQGEAVAIRKWNAAAFADDGTNYATYLCIGQDPTAGPQIWKGNNAATAYSVARASKVAWASALTFGTAIEIGEYGTMPITGMTFFNNVLYVARRDGLWSVSADKSTPLDFGLKAAPDAANGVAIAGHQQFLYFSWKYSTERVYNGIVDDIGLGWKAYTRSGMEAVDSWYEPYIGWLFIARDAGTTGTSQIGIWDGLVYHDLIQGFCLGKRIRCVKTQFVYGDRTRIWFDAGGDLLYFEMPFNKANPYNDPGLKYMPEGVMVSSIIDMGTASRLPKYISDLTALTENLSGNIKVEVDVHADDKCGKVDNLSYWTTLGAFTGGPEEDIAVNFANIRTFQYRLRMYTNDNSKSPIIRGVIPNGFARTPFRLVWNMRITIGNIINPDGSKPVSPDEFYNWLMNVATQPIKITMTSIHSMLHNKEIIIAPPSTFPKQRDTAGIPARSVLTISIMAMRNIK